jgi:hypothetical protein
MENPMKKLIAIAAISVTALFLTACGNEAKAFMSDNATTNGGHNGSVESTSIGKATGRGVATFGMNFSASANTTGDFKGDGMMQDIFSVDKEQRPYYYSPTK